MKYNILIHAINGIGLGHIKRTIIIANGLKNKDYIGNIIFVTNSSNPFLIEKSGFKVEKIDYGIEDTLKGVDFSEYENKSFSDIKKIIKINKIDVIIHDTYFIKSIVTKCKDLKHFLILRDSEIDYLKSIKDLLYKFKQIYIPHTEIEFSDKKHNFYKQFNNINFINYIVDDNYHIVDNKKQIIISPGYGGDYDNTLLFFNYVNNFLINNKVFIKNYEIKFILGKYFSKIKLEINFIKNSKIVSFIDNLDYELSRCDIFIGRGGYNTVNEVLKNNCKSILFEVERFAENQGKRIDFFINNFSLYSLKKGTYDLSIDSNNLEYLLNNDFDKINNIGHLFNGKQNFINNFISELSKKNILIFKHIFLPISENFIHEELTNFNKINPIVIFLKNENLEIFNNNLELYYFDNFKYLLDENYPKINNIDLYLKLLKFIVFLINKYEIKLIYTEFLFDSYFIMKIRYLLPNIKIISAGRGYDVYSFLKKKYINTNLFLNKLDKILVRDNFMYKEITNYGIKKNNIEIVRSFIDFSKYRFISKSFSKLNILIGGRFNNKKGILELLDLINLLSSENFIGNIGLVGDGELKNEILNKINKLGLENKIEYYGFLNHKDFIKKINEYNCFINYSKISINGDNEGMNNIISENILSGNIVFSTIVGGIGEIIKDCETGVVLSGLINIDLNKIKGIFLNNNLNNITKKGYLQVNKIFGKKQSIEKLEGIIKIYN